MLFNYRCKRFKDSSTDPDHYGIVNAAINQTQTSFRTTRHFDQTRGKFINEQVSH